MLARRSASRQAKKVPHMRKYLGSIHGVPDVRVAFTCINLYFVLLPAIFSFTKYPDDARFRIYRVFKKFSMESCLVEVKQYSKSSLGVQGFVSYVPMCIP